MKLCEIKCTENPSDKTEISQVHFLVADHENPDERTEWIEGQLSVDQQTVLNGALLRSKALYQARDILDQLARDYEHLGRSFQ